jgi:acylphosphatase
MVGYRARVQREARDRGLLGQVWNDASDLGKVWIRVQGEEAELEAFRASIERPEGPSRPTGVRRTSAIPPEPSWTDFVIVR